MCDPSSTSANRGPAYSIRPAVNNVAQNPFMCRIAPSLVGLRRSSIDRSVFITSPLRPSMGIIRLIA